METANVPASIRELMAEDVEFSPWTAWALIGLARHRERQRWVTEIVRARLQGSPEVLKGLGALAHPEGVPRSGVVPGLIEWEYYFHGIGCCLTHRTSGESIDVDFYDENGDYFDDFFYLCYLKSLKTPETAEQRLLELHPSHEPLLIAFGELKEIGALETVGDRKAFKLTDICEHLCGAVDEFLKLLDNPVKRFLGYIAIGDWLKAEELVQRQIGELANSVRKKARKQGEQRIAHLLRWYERDRWSQAAFLGLVDAKAPQLDDLIRRNLNSAPGPTMIQTLDLLLKSKDMAWCEEVFQLFQRLDCNKDLPEPSAWRRAGEFLLRTGYRFDEVRELLLKVSDRETSEVALLALEFFPSEARALFRLALRSTIPWERTVAAAVLANLDEPWAVTELIHALNESSDRQFTTSMRGALVCSREQRARDAVMAWERAHPYEKSAGPFYTWEEVSEESRDSWVQHEMSELHDRVMPLRGRVKE